MGVVAGVIASYADVHAILAKRGRNVYQGVRADLPSRHRVILRCPGCIGRDSTYTENPITDRTKSRFQKIKIFKKVATGAEEGTVV